MFACFVTPEMSIGVPRSLHCPNLSCPKKWNYSNFLSDTPGGCVCLWYGGVRATLPTSSLLQCDAPNERQPDQGEQAAPSSRWRGVVTADGSEHHADVLGTRPR